MSDVRTSGEIGLFDGVEPGPKADMDNQHLPKFDFELEEDFPRRRA